MASIINADTSGGLKTTADTSGILQIQSAGTTIMTVGPTGVSTQVGAPAFSAYASGVSSALSSGVDTKVLFDTESFDTNNNFASSRFTPTVAGYYQVNATLRFNGSYTAAAIIFYKNGGNVGYAQNGVQTVTTASTLQYMNGTTDYLEVYTNMTGSSLTVGSTNANTNYFSASLVRSA